MTGAPLLLAILDAQLTPRQREAFLDRYVLDHSAVRVAADIGVTPQAVNLLLGRARERLGRPGGYVDCLREAA